MSESQKVFKGAVSQSVVVIILGSLGLAYFSVMSRLLTKEDFGYYAVITGITGILIEISSAGLGAAIIQKKSPDNQYVSTAFSLSLLIGGTLSVLLFALSPLLSRLLVENQVLTMPLRIISITLLLTSLNSIGRANFIRQLQFFRYGMFEITAFTVSSLLGIYLAYVGWGVYAIIIAVVLNQLLMTIILYIISGFHPRFGIHVGYIREIVSFGGWLTGSSIVRCLYSQFDKLITTRWIPVAALGAYNRPSYFVNEVGGKIFGIFDTILFPILSSIQEDKGKISSGFEKSFLLLIQMTLIMVFAMILASEFLMEIFFGHEWIELIPIFQILCAILIFDSFSRLTDCFYRSLGIVKKYFIVRLFVCVFSAALIIWGCHYGIMGLAIGVCASRIFENLVKMMVLYPYISIDYIRLVGKLFTNNIIPVTLFFLLYLLHFQGMYVSLGITIGYIAIIALVVFVFPHALGELFYSQIYTRLLSKLNTRVLGFIRK